jgi:hypothetical protein
LYCKSGSNGKTRPQYWLATNTTKGEKHREKKRGKNPAKKDKRECTTRRGNVE